MLKPANLKPMISLPKNTDRKTVAELTTFWNGHFNNPKSTDKFIAYNRPVSGRNTLVTPPALELPGADTGVATAATDTTALKPAGTSTVTPVANTGTTTPAAPANTDSAAKAEREKEVIDALANDKPAVPNPASDVIRTRTAAAATAAASRLERTVAAAGAVRKPINEDTKPAAAEAAKAAEAAAPVATAAIDPENLPLQGWKGLKEAVVGKTGIGAGFKAIAQGKFASGLSSVLRNVVTIPVKAAAVLLDGPRKIADVAAVKGKAMVEAGSKVGGFAGALRSFFGSLLQIVGGAIRLAKPAIGIAILALVSGPIGWAIGGFLLGTFVFKEFAAITSDKVDEMQTLKAVRDIVSGAGAAVGSVLSTVTSGVSKLAARKAVKS